MISENDKSLRRTMIAGVAVAVTLVTACAVWATTAELSGAIIAQGQLVVESNTKRIQHPTGGVVGEILVRDGDRVNAGDVVMRLDEVQARANLAILTRGLDEFKARKAREEAERDGDDALLFPSDLMARAADPDIARILNGEHRLFETRRTAREGQKAQLQERKNQVLEEVAGLTSQISGKDNEARWIRDELVGVRELWAKKLVQITRVTALERDAARLEGERGNLVASIAQARGKLSEIQLQMMQVDQDMRTEVGKSLADLRSKIAEFQERSIAADDQLRRVVLRAPQNGIVHQLDVHSVGGVVSPGQTVMLIVPTSDALRIESKVQPQDIDQLHVGQKTILRFPSFNQRVTPELNGKIVYISADVSVDQKSGASFYNVRTVLLDGEQERLDGFALVPGMPVETFFNTSSRTVASYALRPFTDQLHRAFRGR